MNSLDKRISYLGLADFDYLSARLLLLSALGNTGMPKAAEAFEKLLKLYLLLSAKITDNKELTEGELKLSYGHNLLSLFREAKKSIPAHFPAEWDDFFTMLQDSYSRRYPENWKEFTLIVSVSQIDEAYMYLRNNIIRNFPPEEHVRVRHFGTFIYDAYKTGISARLTELGRLTPKEILMKDNVFFDKFDIDFGYL